MSLGLDATSLVYNMLWAAMVWTLGLGAPWEDASYAVPDDSLPPLPHTSGRRVTLWKRRQCTPKGLFRQ
eukprot:4036190-Pyramimonas_sp.AAC.1